MFHCYLHFLNIKEVKNIDIWQDIIISQDVNLQVFCILSLNGTFQF